MARTLLVTEQTAKRERRVRQESIHEQEVLQDTELGQYILCMDIAQRTVSPEHPLNSSSPHLSNSTRIPVPSENSRHSLGDSIMSLNTNSK